MIHRKLTGAELFGNDKTRSIARIIEDTELALTIYKDGEESLQESI